MRKVYILFLIVILSCSDQSADGIWHLSSLNIYEFQSTNLTRSDSIPFSTWEFKGDTLFIDGKAKTFKKGTYSLKIFGADLENEFSIETWNSSELFLKQRGYDGKEYLFYFKR